MCQGESIFFKLKKKEILYAMESVRSAAVSVARRRIADLETVITEKLEEFSQGYFSPETVSHFVERSLESRGEKVEILHICHKEEYDDLCLKRYSYSPSFDLEVADEHDAPNRRIARRVAICELKIFCSAEKVGADDVRIMFYMHLNDGNGKVHILPSDSYEWVTMMLHLSPWRRLDLKASQKKFLTARVCRDNLARMCEIFDMAVSKGFEKLDSVFLNRCTASVYQQVWYNEKENRNLFFDVFCGLPILKGSTMCASCHNRCIQSMYGKRLRLRKKAKT